MGLRPRETRPALLILTAAFAWGSVPPPPDEAPLAAARAATRIALAPRAKTAEPPAGLTPDDWDQIRRGVRQSEYRASPVPESGAVTALQAPNREQAYRTLFQPEGIEIVPQAPAGASWRLGVAVNGYGYRGDVRPLRRTDPRALRDGVVYRRGPLTEWYVNRPGGLEQGFELEEPLPRRCEPLVVAMAVGGNLEASSDRDGAAFSDRFGRVHVRYTGLKAWDADNRPLRARVEAVHREIRLVVDVHAARFPVTVDPTFVQEAELFGHADAAGTGGLGWSVSLDGDTAVVGAPLDSVSGVMSAGSVFVFVRSGTTWTAQQRLLASDAVANDHFGNSVSLSGNTVVVGALAGSSNGGSAYVFVRAGTSWAQQQKLLASDGAPFDIFGGSVSVSGDTAVVGAYMATPRAARMRARRTCSCGRARPGPSSRSSSPPTQRRPTTSATRCRSPGTRRWSGRP